MQIELSPADASYISELVKNGYFPAEEEQGVPLEIHPDVRGANSLLIFETLPKRISKASLDTLYVLCINLPLY